MEKQIRKYYPCRTDDDLAVNGRRVRKAQLLYKDVQQRFWQDPDAPPDASPAMRRKRCEAVALAVHNKAAQLSGMFRDSMVTVGDFGLFLEVAWSLWEADFVGVVTKDHLEDEIPVAATSIGGSGAKKVPKAPKKRRHLPAHLRY